MDTTTTLVLGGTGKTGRRVAQRLRAAGQPVRIGSRSGEPRFDWADRSTWPAALHGASAIYIAYHPDLAAPGAAGDIGALIDLARESGARRVVLLSGRGEPEAERCEQIVRGSGLEWTVVRASWFDQNFSEGQLVEPVLAGEVALPVGDVGEPFVDADDIADVAAAALVDDRHAGQLYEVTGPELWTFREAVAEIARAAGREIRYVEVPLDDYLAALEQAQVPAEMASLIRYLFAEVLDGRNASVQGGVERALGRPARGFRRYAAETAASGVWAAEPVRP